MLRTEVRVGKDAGFSIRLDSELQDAFIVAAASAHRPAAQIVRELMRDFVEDQEQRSFELEARRQSGAIAARTRAPGTDDHASLRELAAHLGDDDFACDWQP